MHGDQNRNETAWIAVRMPACKELSSFWPEPASINRYQGTSSQIGSSAFKGPGHDTFDNCYSNYFR